MPINSLLNFEREHELEDRTWESEWCARYARSFHGDNWSNINHVCVAIGKPTEPISHTKLVELISQGVIKFREPMFRELPADVRANIIYVKDCHIYDDEGYCELCPPGQAFNGYGCHACHSNVHDLEGTQVDNMISDCKFNWPEWSSAKYRFMSHNHMSIDQKQYNGMLWMLGAVTVTGRKLAEPNMSYKFMRGGSDWKFVEEKYNGMDGCEVRQDEFCTKCKTDTHVLQTPCAQPRGDGECYLEDDLIWNVDHGRTGNGWGNLNQNFKMMGTKCEPRSNKKKSTHTGCMMMSPNYNGNDWYNEECLVCDYRNDMKMCVQLVQPAFLTEKVTRTYCAQRC